MDNGLIGSFGTCSWHPDLGVDLVSEKDRDRFPKLTTAVFLCIKEDGDWLEIGYGEKRFCVSRLLFKLIPSPMFKLNENVIVLANNLTGIVSALTWHFKESKPIYLLSFNGKQSSRRYGEEELALSLTKISQGPSQ